MNEKEMLLKAIELFGSKRQVALKLGYIGSHGGQSSHINRVLNGKGHLPSWRLERLRLLLMREQIREIKEGHGLTDVSCVHGSRWIWWPGPDGKGRWEQVVWASNCDCPDPPIPWVRKRGQLT